MTIWNCVKTQLKSFILVKSTELKQKLLSDIDSVSGDVHIEKITKNKGIETEEKIYKRIRTIKD